MKNKKQTKYAVAGAQPPSFEKEEPKEVDLTINGCQPGYY